MLDSEGVQAAASLAGQIATVTDVGPVMDALTAQARTLTRPVNAGALQPLIEALQAGGPSPDGRPGMVAQQWELAPTAMTQMALGRADQNTAGRIDALLETLQKTAEWGALVPRLRRSSPVTAGQTCWPVWTISTPPSRCHRLG